MKMKRSNILTELEKLLDDNENGERELYYNSPYFHRFISVLRNTNDSDMDKFVAEVLVDIFRKNKTDEDEIVSAYQNRSVINYRN